MFKRLKNIENAQINLIRSDDNESIYYTPRSEFDSKDDEDKDKKKKKKMQTMSLTTINFFLLVVTEKNLTLTF